MNIEKNGKIFVVKENKSSWTLATNIGGIPLTYNVKKADCATFDELKQFVADNSAF